MKEELLLVEGLTGIIGVSIKNVDEIMSFVFILISTISALIGLIQMIKKAKADGVVTDEEKKEIIDKAKDIANDTINAIKDIKEEHKDGESN